MWVRLICPFSESLLVWPLPPEYFSFPSEALQIQIAPDSITPGHRNTSATIKVAICLLGEVFKVRPGRRPRQTPGYAGEVMPLGSLGITLASSWKKVVSDREKGLCISAKTHTSLTWTSGNVGGWIS